MKKTAFFLLAVFWIGLSLAPAVQSKEELGRKLRSAILLGKTDEVKEIIRAGADVNEKVDFGATRRITPLFCVFTMCVGNQAEIGKLLIDAGAKVDEKFDGFSLLHVAANFAGNKALTELLISKGLDVNTRIDPAAGSMVRNSTPLHFAAGSGNLEVAEALINNGAAVNATASIYIYTPLHLAALNGKKEVAELLIDKGADVNAMSASGDTPLDLAIKKGKQECVELLRKRGGKPGK